MDKLLKKSFPGWPSFTEQEGEAVKRVLLSNKVNYWGGEKCKLFERDFAKMVGSKFAISVSNGTVALDLALFALGVGQNNCGKKTDQVIVTPRTFIASVSAIVNAGATPIFADVDEKGNIDAESLASRVTSKTKCVVVVHLAGQPCDMDPIIAISKQKNIKLIEDCAQAHGAVYKGRTVGSIGDIGTWSFCQDKIITTGGEGGMVTTNDKELWEKIWSKKDHGKVVPGSPGKTSASGFKWQVGIFGTNYRMTEMQAAIGIIQLRKLEEWLQRRNDIAAMIKNILGPFSGPSGIIRIPETECSNCYRDPKRCCRNAYYKFYAYVRPENLAKGWSRDRIVEALTYSNIPCMHGICPEVYLENAFNGTTFRPKKRLDVAKTLGETSIMFLTHPTITDLDMERIDLPIKRVLKLATKLTN